jgi:hypothetical protein
VGCQFVAAVDDDLDHVAVQPRAHAFKRTEISNSSQCMLQAVALFMIQINVENITQV